MEYCLKLVRLDYNTSSLHHQNKKVMEDLGQNLEVTTKPPPVASDGEPQQQGRYKTTTQEEQP